MIVDIKSRREIPAGSAVYAGEDGYAIKSRKGPIIGYAVEDSTPCSDGKRHLAKVSISDPWNTAAHFSKEDADRALKRIRESEF